MTSNDAVNGIRAEAERWLSIAEAQLTGRDFAVSKRFATRAREADPSLDAADQILAVVDTLLAGDNRIHNNPDFYGILQVPHQTDDRSLIRAQFRWLRDLIGPVVRRRLPFADRAFALVSEAWSVLSSDKKSEYDNALDNGTDLYPDREPFQFDQSQSQQKRASRRSNRISKKNLADDNDSELHVDNKEEDDSTFWTSCPYCYYMFEYPRVYEDCCLRCQNCFRAFQSIKIAPPIVNGEVTNSPSYVFFPMGAPATEKDKAAAAAASSGNPVAPAVVNPSSKLVETKGNVAQRNVNLGGRRKARAQKSSASKKFANNTDNYVEISESSESDGGAELGNNKRKNEKNVNGTSDGIHVNVSESRQEAGVEWGNMKRKKFEIGKKIDIEKYTTWKDSSLGNAVKPQGEKGKKTVVEAGEDFIAAIPRVSNPLQTGLKVAATTKQAVAARTRTAAEEWARLDLNVKFSNDADELAGGTGKGNGVGTGEADAIEGTGFFEGLDEFLSSLPILNAVGGDKVKAVQ